MLKHHKNVHNKTCTICKKTFSSLELKEAHCVEHMHSYYVCQFCNKIIKLRSSLLRHLKKQHNRDTTNMDFNTIKAVTKINICDKNDRTFGNVEERVLNFNDIEIDLPTHFKMQRNISEQELCLLTNSDQGLTLGIVYQ